jgi:hypothetical protein
MCIPGEETEKTDLLYLSSSTHEPFLHTCSAKYFPKATLLVTLSIINWWKQGKIEG